MTQTGERALDDQEEGSAHDEGKGTTDDEADHWGATGSGDANDSEEQGMAGDGGAAGGKVIECLIRVGGVDFVLVPATRRVGGVEVGGVASRGGNATKRRLWGARREARLTQAQLARRLGRSQAFVSQAESGSDYVSERYVNKVLAACELPLDWGLPKASSDTPSDWDLDPRDIAGIDPETLVPVRRGSERDRQLRRTFVWWEGYEDET